MSENNTITITQKEYDSLLKARELVDYLTYCSGTEWLQAQLKEMEIEKNLNLGMFAKPTKNAKWGVRARHG